MTWQRLSCDRCGAPVHTTRAADRKAGLVIVDAEPTSAGQYRLNEDVQGMLRARKLTPTERARTGFGAKLYRNHEDTCTRRNP